jgi:hypothetical protein
LKVFKVALQHHAKNEIHAFKVYWNVFFVALQHHAKKDIQPPKNFCVNNKVVLYIQIVEFLVHPQIIKINGIYQFYHL